MPPVVFSSFIRYNSDDKEGKPIEEKGISAKDGMTLSYKDNVATFEFSSLNYYNTFKNQYAYRLEGFNDTWIQLGTGTPGDVHESGRRHVYAQGQGIQQRRASGMRTALRSGLSSNHHGGRRRGRTARTRCSSSSHST